MEPFYLYLLKSSFAMGIFYLFYMAVLKKDTFLHLRRWYFGITLFFALVYPVIQIGYLTRVLEWFSAFGSPKAVAAGTVTAEKGVSQVIPSEPEFFSALFWQNLAEWIF